MSFTITRVLPYICFEAMFGVESSFNKSSLCSDLVFVFVFVGVDGSSPSAFRSPSAFLIGRYTLASSSVRSDTGYQQLLRIMNDLHSPGIAHAPNHNGIRSHLLNFRPPRSRPVGHDQHLFL